jgi:predicted ATP-grasp superfamily ATP-dependent carboligase
MRALIVEDGLSRQALAAARALHAADWTVGVAASRPRGLAASSRATAREHGVPAPEGHVDAFVAAVRRVIAAERYEVVFGARDVDVLALSTRRDELGAVFPYPPHRVLLRAFDKLELGGAARAAGIAMPATRWATVDTLETVPVPVQVKARLHPTFASPTAPPRLETTVAHTRGEAADRVREIRGAGGCPLLQEHIGEGRLMALVVLADAASRIVSRCQQVADLVWPTHAGVSVRAHSVRVDEALAERVGVLLVQLGWTGLTQLQFLAVPDRDPLLIDFNGRFYGSLALAEGAGVNLPAQWAALATGRPVTGGHDARPGVRYQWLLGDVRRALATRRGVARRLAEAAWYGVGAKQSVWRLRDPVPGVRELAMTIEGVGAHRARRLMRAQ